MKDTWLIGGIIAVVLPFVIRVLTSGAARAVEPGTLRYGTPARIFGVLMTAALPVMVILIQIFNPKPTRAPKTCRGFC